MGRKRDRKAFRRIAEKSEDDFERLITYISAGALGLSITFIEKLVPLNNSLHSEFLITGWILLALTLILNLFSHNYSSRMSAKSENDFDNKVKGLHELIAKRNHRIDCINWTSLGLLTLGLGFTIYFTSKNAMYMADQRSVATKASQEINEEIEIPIQKSNSSRTIIEEPHGKEDSIDNKKEVK